MPVYALQIRATLENVSKLMPTTSIYWRLRFQCSSCNELGKTVMEFSSLDEVYTNRGSVNLTSRCQFCGRSRTVDVVKNSEQPYGCSDPPVFQTIVKFECRGMEPVEFTPQEGWTVEAEDSSAKYTDVDLKEREWVDYDAIKNRPVGIYGLEHQFVKE